MHKVERTKHARRVAAHVAYKHVRLAQELDLSSKAERGVFVEAATAYFDPPTAESAVGRAGEGYAPMP